MEKQTIKKQTIWNKLFHKKQLQEEETKYRKYLIMKGFYNELFNNIANAKTLVELLDNHKWAWKLGYRNINLGPCSYGMFRAESIEKLDVDNVYLGNIWGLWTNTIRFWNSHSTELMGTNGFGVNPNTKIYDLIMNQYRTLLRKNISAIKYDITEYIDEYESINEPVNPFKLCA